MAATLDDVTKKIKAEPTAEDAAAREMVRRAREQALSLTGPDGLLKQLTKTVLERTGGCHHRLCVCTAGPATSWPFLPGCLEYTLRL